MSFAALQNSKWQSFMTPRIKTLLWTLKGFVYCLTNLKARCSIEMKFFTSIIVDEIAPLKTSVSLRSNIATHGHRINNRSDRYVAWLQKMGGLQSFCLAFWLSKRRLQLAFLFLAVSLQNPSLLYTFLSLLRRRRHQLKV